MSYLEETRKYEKKMKQFFKQQKKIAMNKIEYECFRHWSLSFFVFSLDSTEFMIRISASM